MATCDYSIEDIEKSINKITFDDVTLISFVKYPYKALINGNISDNDIQQIMKYFNNHFDTSTNKSISK